MKKLLIYPVLIISMAACNNNQAEREAEIDMATSAAVDSLNDMNERIRLEDSMENVASATVSGSPGTVQPRTAGKKPGKKGGSDPVEAPSPGNDGNTAGTGTVAAEPSGNEEHTGTAGTETDEPATEEKKKQGINNTVKGAVIGAGAGAVGGAIINKKNPGKGAIIGGVVGAGAGAVTGVIIDKNKKKKEAKDTVSTNTTTKEPNTKEKEGGVNP